MYPSESVSTAPAKAAVFGACPIAANIHLHGISESAPVFKFFTTTAEHLPSVPAFTSATAESHSTEIFGFSATLSAIIFDARNESRLWIIFTDAQNFERNNASSHAVSPPPTTTTSAPL